MTIVGSRRASGYGRETAGSLAAELAGAGSRGDQRDGLRDRCRGPPRRARPRPHRRRPRRRRGRRLPGRPPGASPADLRARAGGLRDGARGDALALELSGPQPDHGRARPDDDRGRGRDALRLADHRGDGDESGRDVGAVPGPVSSRASAGANELLARGACVVRDAQDVLDAMLGPGRGRPCGATGPALEPDLAKVLAGLERAGAPDALARELGISGSLGLDGSRPARAARLRQLLGARRLHPHRAGPSRGSEHLTWPRERQRRRNGRAGAHPGGALDRRLGLRRRGRDPGGPEGVRALRRPRDDRDHGADRAEHGRGERGRAGPARR